MSNEQLHILSARAGLSVNWIDANGRLQTVSPEALRKVLEDRKSVV